MSEENTNAYYRIQMILDQSDPYLLEALADKSEEELMEYLERLMKELEYINRTENKEWLRRHQKIIETVKAVYESKLLNRGDEKGGMIVL